MKRTVEPEILDDLNPTDPKAIRSRNDLRRINSIMGNARCLSRMLQSNASLPQTFVELGSGDGSLLLNVLRRLPNDQRRTVFLIDRLPTVPPVAHAQFRQLNCDLHVVTSDVFEWLKSNDATGDACVITNLFLHHFDTTELKRLLRLIAARCHTLAACEPRRSHWALAAARLTGIIGANDVTRHDAAVSVMAGFNGRELSDLWPSTDAWSLTEEFAPPFSHRFMAVQPIV